MASCNALTHIATLSVPVASMSFSLMTKKPKFGPGLDLKIGKLTETL